MQDVPDIIIFTNCVEFVNVDILYSSLETKSSACSSYISGNEENEKRERTRERVQFFAFAELIELYKYSKTKKVLDLYSFPILSCIN